LTPTGSANHSYLFKGSKEMRIAKRKRYRLGKIHALLSDPRYRPRTIPNKKRKLLEKIKRAEMVRFSFSGDNGIQFAVD